MLALFLSVMMVLSMNGFTVLAADAGTEESEPHIVGEALTEEEEPVLPEEEEPSSEESAAGEPEPQYAPDEEEIPEGATVEEAAEEPEAADDDGADAAGFDADGSYAAEEATLDGAEPEHEPVADDAVGEPETEETVTAEETEP